LQFSQAKPSILQANKRFAESEISNVEGHRLQPPAERLRGHSCKGPAEGDCQGIEQKKAEKLRSGIEAQTFFEVSLLSGSKRRKMGIKVFENDPTLPSS